MSPADILEQAAVDEVLLALTPAGTIKAIGAPSAVNRWVDAIRENKAGIVLELKSRAAESSRWWRLHYADCHPVELVVVPDETRSTMMKRHPDAVAAEPYAPVWRKPSTPMTESQENAIRGWMELIGERDEEIVDGLIEHCERDADSRDYFLARAYRATAH